MINLQIYILIYSHVKTSWSLAKKEDITKDRMHIIIARKVPHKMYAFMISKKQKFLLYISEYFENMSLLNFNIIS